MADLSLEFGGDILLDDTGDWATVDGLDEARQRIIRRFLSTSALPPSATFPQGTVADDRFAKDYGGNARAYIDRMGNSQTTDTVRNILMDQIHQEVEVSRTQPPVLSVTFANGVIRVEGTVSLANNQVIVIPETELN